MAACAAFLGTLMLAGNGCSSPPNRTYTGQAGPMNASSWGNQEGAASQQQSAQNVTTSTEQANNGSELPPPTAPNDQAQTQAQEAGARPADNLGARSSGRGR